MTLNKILSIAAAEIGYREGPDNDSKYGAAYGMNGQPWCVMFLWWVFKQAGSDLFPQTAHCDGVRSFARGIGRWFNHAEIGISIDLQPGDIVVWDYNSDGSGDHIGLVETVANNNRFITIEGNYSDMVTRVNRDLSGISGLYRPNYPVELPGASEPDEEPDEAPAAIDLPELRNGSTGYPVRVLQTILRTVNDISVGPWGVDGDFGNDTENAVRIFQARAHISSTGVVGAETWKALLEGV